MIFTGKALTIWQPWAEAIRTFGKDVENRRWATSYRGPLAIHAGRCDPDFQRALELMRTILGPRDYRETAAFYLTGHIVAIAILADCVTLDRLQEPALWAFGPYCLVLQGRAAHQAGGLEGNPGPLERDL